MTRTKFGTRGPLKTWPFGVLFYRMITMGVIKNGATYLSQHLRKNDYWAEGKKEVAGEWIGDGASRLGLKGAVTEKPFDALRRNRRPDSPKQKLTARERKERVAFIDIQLSAPKDVSVLALVGNDDRVRDAFTSSVKTALVEMETFAAVRERRGSSVNTEKVRLTGNIVGALFFHDTSRDLDPQLHAHAVLGNATWDAERGEWFALQPAEMLRASIYVRQVLYRELAGRLRTLGYEIHDMNPLGFSIRGVELLRERFSKRSQQVQKLAEEFAQKKGRKPTKREVEILVRESRGNKLTEISTREVRTRQRQQLNATESGQIDALVRIACERAKHIRRTDVQQKREAEKILEAALRHVFERASVAREGEVLATALQLHPEFDGWRELRTALEKHPEVILSHGELTLSAVNNEEYAAVRRARKGRNTRFAIGDSAHLPQTLTPAQRAAASALLAGRDMVSVLLGDAGTGKTTTLSAIEKAHRASGGAAFIALAPTTRARDAIEASGFPEADTVQKFLASETLQRRAVDRVILVDVAGLMSTRQIDGLTRIAETMHARLLLVGDTKQHYSVERGDALRNVVKHAGLPVVHLSEVLRQRGEADRRFSRLLAANRVFDAVELANRRGMIRGAPGDQQLFAMAAEHYATNRKKGIDTLVVIPLWEEIDRFSGEVRPALRAKGLLGKDEVQRESVRPLTWTAEQKSHWNQYKVGDHLQFVRTTRFFRRGVSAEVVAILEDGLRVCSANGREAKITQKQRAAFDVGRPQTLAISAGERVLIRGREDTQGFTNGDFKDVASVDAASGKVVFTDGKVLPKDFTAWTYGHALTSYRAQGSTAEESLLVLGEVSTRALARRQFYVGNTRYRGSHKIYVSRREDLLDRLAEPDDGRELATEFIERQHLSVAERFAPRPMLRMRSCIRNAWLGAAEQMRRVFGERENHNL